MQMEAGEVPRRTLGLIPALAHSICLHCRRPETVGFLSGVRSSNAYPRGMPDKLVPRAYFGLMILASLSLVTACSRDPAEVSESEVRVFGTAAVGAPLVGGRVVAFPVDPYAGVGYVSRTTTDASGQYSMDQFDVFPLPPYLIEVTGDDTYPAQYSVSLDGGLTNVTPLTTLLLSRFFGENVKAMLFRDDIPVPSVDQISTARAEVAAYLLTRPSKFDGHFTVPVDVSAVTDFISTPFTPAPGDAYDDALTQLGQSLMDGETIDGVVEHMLHAADPPADLMSIFPLEFEAHCVGIAHNRPVPNGLVQVSFKANGEIVVGQYSYTLRPGDRVGLDMRDLRSWSFDFRGRSVEVPGFGTVSDGLSLSTRFRNLLLTLFVEEADGFGFADCESTAEIPFSATHPPSTLALIRLLEMTVESTFDGRQFFCPESLGFPGLAAGRNVLIFDPNGAMRVNSYLDGYAVHLPSLRLAVDAEFVASTNGLVPVLRHFFGTRGVIGAGDFDEVLVALGDTGIISAAFSRGREQNSLGIECGP